ncbi:hypothetical protein [Tsuneonella mangrovi]|uniref:hypothetical protein n=1 Tax=Tsuneonella mangrovi TaxID=1982042 RepID=UPI000BA2237B|nr:hypothetical protein [Tsuneonella mangrovi]
MKLSIAAAALALATAHVASAAVPQMYEQQVAQQEEKMIFAKPIAGIENKYWFHYRVKVVAARKDLVSDLGRADDIKDRRHAWDEYNTRLQKQRMWYITKMARKGYRSDPANLG